MKKYYYVCPRCGRRWSYFWKRSEMHCAFCGQEWDPYDNRHKKLHGSYFSWSAFFVMLAVIVVIAAMGLTIADRMGYDATQRVKTLLGMPVVEENERPRSRAEARTSETSGGVESGDEQIETERATDSAEKYQAEESRPFGRVRERQPEDESTNKTLERVIYETETEAASSENSDRDWDF